MNKQLILISLFLFFIECYGHRVPERVLIRRTAFNQISEKLSTLNLPNKCAKTCSLSDLIHLKNSGSIYNLRKIKMSLGFGPRAYKQLYNISCVYCLSNEIVFRPDYTFGVINLNYHYNITNFTNVFAEILDEFNNKGNLNFTYQLINDHVTMLTNSFDYYVTISTGSCYSQKNHVTLPPYLLSINPHLCGTKVMISSMLMYSFGANYYHQTIYRDRYFKIHFDEVINEYITYYYKNINLYLVNIDSSSLMMPTSYQYSYGDNPAITWANNSLLPEKTSHTVFSTSDIGALKCMAVSVIS